MVWQHLAEEIFLKKGKGNKSVDKMMDGVKYREENLPEAAKDLRSSRMKRLEDSASMWPSQSPDLNTDGTVLRSQLSFRNAEERRWKKKKDFQL